MHAARPRANAGHGVKKYSNSSRARSYSYEVEIIKSCLQLVNVGLIIVANPPTAVGCCSAIHRDGRSRKMTTAVARRTRAVVRFAVRVVWHWHWTDSPSLAVASGVARHRPPVRRTLLCLGRALDLARVIDPIARGISTWIVVVGRTRARCDRLCATRVDHTHATGGRAATTPNDDGAPARASSPRGTRRCCHIGRDRWPRSQRGRIPVAGCTVQEGN